MHLGSRETDNKEKTGNHGQSEQNNYSYLTIMKVLDDRLCKAQVSFCITHANGSATHTHPHADGISHSYA